MPYSIVNATNAKPIVIELAGPVNFRNGTTVEVEGVLGLLAANGPWPVGPIDSTRLALIGSDGTKSPAYAGGGQVSVAMADTSGSGAPSKATKGGGGMPDPAEAYLASIRRIVQQEIAATQPGLFEYVVVSANPDGTVHIQPADATLGLPPFSSLVVWTGLPGTSVQPTEGSHLAIAFLDGSRGKPIVVGCFDATATVPGLVPTSIQIGGVDPSPPTATPGAAVRVGDAVGPFLATSGSSRVGIG